MPRKRDLNLDRRIHELHTRGLGVRAIARELGVSSSAVSRTLQQEPTRRLVAEFTQRVERAEKEMAIVRECMAILARITIQVGRQHRNELLAVLMRWPDDHFKNLCLNNRL